MGADVILSTAVRAIFSNNRSKFDRYKNNAFVPTVRLTEYNKNDYKYYMGSGCCEYCLDLSLFMLLKTLKIKAS